MAYHKYIKKGGKVFGPYLYETKRLNGKVVNTYLGPAKKNESNDSANSPLVKDDKKVFLVNISLIVLISVFLGLTFGIFSNLLGQDYVFFAPAIEKASNISFDAQIVDRPVIGKPVKWIKRVDLKEGENVILLPKEAENIVIKKIAEANVAESEVVEKEKKVAKETV